METNTATLNFQFSTPPKNELLFVACEHEKGINYHLIYIDDHDCLCNIFGFRTILKLDDISLWAKLNNVHDTITNLVNRRLP